jgi:hypothetical protein
MPGGVGGERREAFPYPDPGWSLAEPGVKRKTRTVARVAGDRSPTRALNRGIKNTLSLAFDHWIELLDLPTAK